MATFLAIILFGVSLNYYDKESISLEMFLVICALCLIVCAIDCKPTSSDIKEALLEVFSNKNTEETPSNLDETSSGGNEYEDANDIDQFPFLHQ